MWNRQKVYLAYPDSLIVTSADLHSPCLPNVHFLSPIGGEVKYEIASPQQFAVIIVIIVIVIIVIVVIVVIDIVVIDVIVVDVIVVIVCEQRCFE